MPTPGIVVFSTSAPESLEAVVAYARMAEERGFRSILLSEVGSDSLALAQHLASVTTRIQVGTCVTNIYLRPPLLAALQAMTIDRFAPGRVLLGLGTGSSWMNQVYGLAMDKPAATLRQYLKTVASVLRGDHAGLQQLTAAGWGMPRPTHKIPVYVGGVSPQSLTVTGELADGSFVTQCAPQGFQEIQAGLVRGAQRAGRVLSEIPLVPLVHCCVCPDRTVALRSVQRALAPYAQSPYYNRFLARPGFGQEADQIRAARDSATAEAVISETMAAQVTAMGTAQDCQKKIEEFEKAGASHVILWPSAIDGDYERGVRAALDAFGQ